MRRVIPFLSRGLSFSTLLYAVALPTSMAGMEFFGWLSFLFIVLLYGVDHLGAREFNWAPPGVEVPLLGFLLTCQIGAFVLPNITYDERLFILGSLRWIVLFYILYFIFLNSLVKVEKFIKVLAVTSFIVVLYSLIQVFVGWDIFRSTPYKPTAFMDGNLWRAKGFFSNPITYANSFGLMGLFFLGVFLVKANALSRKQRYQVLAFLGLFFAAILLSLTRGVWLGVFVGLFTLPLIFNKSGLGKLILGIAVSIILLFSFVQPLRTHFISSFSRDHSSVDKRVRLWKSNWAMFKDHPWLGVGLHQNSKNIQKYHVKVHKRKGFESHAHNMPLQVLAGTGFFGFVFFFWFYGACLWKSFFHFRRGEPGSTARGVYLGAFACFVGFFVSGLTEVNFFDGEVTHVFLALSSIMFATMKKDESSLKTSNS